MPIRVNPRHVERRVIAAAFQGAPAPHVGALRGCDMLSVRGPWDGVRVPGQGNNAYIFPGVGLGVVACRARRVTDRMFAAAARTLASLVLPQDLELGRIYPALTRIREVFARIGTAVAEVAFEDGLAGVPRPADVTALVKAEMWEPRYRSYV